MKLARHRKPQGTFRSIQGPDAARGTGVSLDHAPLPVLVANIFAKLHLPQRVRILRRLLMPAGPLALAVLGGGAFVKFVGQARWPRMAISLEDAARLTPNQVFELVRYVEQSNPQVLQQVMAVLSRDATTMSAVGATLAAIVIRHLSTAVRR